MKDKFKGFVKSTKGFVGKHSPEILTGLGVTGFIASIGMAVYATPKALKLVDEAEKVKGEPLTKVETVKVAWKPYIPTMITATVSTMCIIGGTRVSSKRNAALATAYAMSEKALSTYRDKVVETIGEKKEKEIREQISQDKVDAQPVSNSTVIVTKKGESLCMDAMTGRYFRSDLDKIRKALNELNRDMVNHNYISLNTLYTSIGLPTIKNGDRLGWNLDDGLIDLSLDTCLTEDEEPCVVIEFTPAAKYDFDRMF